MSDSTNATNAPSLIGGHVQYVKGAAESAIGSLTGATAWSSSGDNDKQTGIDSMKAASEARGQQTSNPTVGKVEEMAGRLSGCEGMEKEGSQAQQ